MPKHVEEVSDERTRRFKLRDSYLHFRLEDVLMVMGLYCDCVTTYCKRKKEQYTFEEHLEKRIDQDKDNVVRALMRPAYKGESDIKKSFVKQLLGYIIGSLFFPITSCSQSTCLSYNVDDLSILEQWASAHATHKLLMDDVYCSCPSQG